MKNPSLQDLIGGITSVTLGDDEARRRRVQKSVLEREGPPVFDVAVEIIDRNTWRIHHNLSEAVDAILSGVCFSGPFHNTIKCALVSHLYWWNPKEEREISFFAGNVR